MEEWTQYLPRLLDSPTAANSHIYICVHCPVEERSPINARYFHEILAKSGIDLPPLPPAVDRDLPTQLSLF